VRVHYDADGNVRVTMGPDATLADVLAHKIVVESIQRAHSRGYLRLSTTIHPIPPNTSLLSGSCPV